MRTSLDRPDGAETPERMYGSHEPTAVDGGGKAPLPPGSPEPSSDVSDRVGAVFAGLAFPLALLVIVAYVVFELLRATA